MQGSQAVLRDQTAAASTSGRDASVQHAGASADADSPASFASSWRRRLLPSSWQLQGKVLLHTSLPIRTLYRTCAQLRLFLNSVDPSSGKQFIFLCIPLAMENLATGAYNRAEEKHCNGASSTGEAENGGSAGAARTGSGHNAGQRCLSGP